MDRMTTPDVPEIRVTVLGIELSTRDDIAAAQRANANLFTAVREDISSVRARVVAMDSKLDKILRHLGIDD